MDGNEWQSAPDVRYVDAQDAGPEQGNGAGSAGEVIATPPSADEAAAEEPAAAATAATDAADEGDDSGVFQAELADAMHGAARNQHQRIVGDLEQRRAAHVEGVRSQSTTEADELKAQADRDVADVEAWAEAEIRRIQTERERRLDARRQEVDGRLEWHGSVVEREIAVVEESIAAYRVEIDDFFARLDAEGDPSAIAGLAARVPAMPRLSEVSAAARARALAELPEPAPDAASAPESPALDGSEEATVSEARLVAVMDPLAASGQGGETGRASVPLEPKIGSPTIPSEAAVATVEDEASGHSRTPVSAGVLLTATPAYRPFSWLVRGDSRDDRDDRRDDRA